MSDKAHPHRYFANSLGRGALALTAAASMVLLGNGVAQSAVIDAPAATNVEQTSPTTIIQALDEMLLRSPRAAAARAQLGIAKAAMAAAIIYPNPGLEMDNGFKAELTYRVGAFIPLEPPWKMVLRILSAKKQITQSDLQIQQTLWALRGELRRAYVEMVVAQETLGTLESLTQLTGRLSDVAQKRFSAGDVAKLDVYKAKLALEQAEIDSQQGQRRVLQAREQLNVVMGRTIDSTIVVPALGENTFKLKAEETYLLPDLSQPLPPLTYYLNMAMGNRLELKVLKQQIKVGEADLKVAYANIWPNSQVSFGHSKVLNFPSGPTVQGWYMTGQFTAPLGNVNQGEIARLRATIRQLKFEVGGQENLISGQVDLAYRKLWNAREVLRKYQEELLAHSEQVAHLGQLAYQNGQSDITSALIAQQANVQVRNQYLSIVLAYEQAFTDLEQSTGHLLQ